MNYMKYPMKKKILNWIYGICRRILATEKKPLKWPIEKKIPIIRIQADRIVPEYTLRGESINYIEYAKNQIIRDLLMQVENFIFIEEITPYEDRNKRFSGFIEIIQRKNETDKNK